MRKIDFLLKDTRNTSSYHFRSIIPKDLRIIFNGRPSFTISLRTGIYKDARAKSIILYNITQSIFSKIRMGNLNLDIEGIKEILKVEIQRSLKHSQHIQIESQSRILFSSNNSVLTFWNFGISDTTYELRCWNQRMIEILRNGFFKYVIRNSI